MTEDELNTYLENNNMILKTYAGVGGISINIDTDKKHSDDALFLSQLILYNPRLTEENLQKAKDRIRDSLMRQEDSALSISI